MTSADHRDYLEILTVEVAEKGRQLAELRRQAEEIERQRAGLRAELEEMRHVARLVAVRAGEDPSIYAQSEGTPPPHGIPAPRPRPHADVIVEVLREAGRPLKVQAIIAAVRAAGQPLPDDPKLQYGAIYSALRRRLGQGKDFGRNTRGDYLLLADSPAPSLCPCSVDKDPTHERTRIEAVPVLRSSGCAADRDARQFQGVGDDVLVPV